MKPESYLVTFWFINDHGYKEQKTVLVELNFIHENLRSLLDNGEYTGTYSNLAVQDVYLKYAAITSIVNVEAYDEDN